MQNIMLNTPYAVLYLVDNIIVSVCVFIIFLAIIIDFTEFHQRDGIKKEKRSIVETGTMLLFFLSFYLLIRFNIGQIHINFSLPLILLNIFGLLVLIIGCVVNINGRLNLGKNWSNQIKIYDDHAFVSKGVYSFIRHPLYASMIWIFLAASLVYMNYLALLSTIAIFIPFMYYRAKQEEFLLGREFKNYRQYQKDVGMFFPKVKW